MAIFVPGMKCVLCALPMAAREEVVLFSSFVPIDGTRCSSSAMHPSTRCA
jgi:hypothetical protein